MNKTINSTYQPCVSSIKLPAHFAELVEASKVELVSMSGQTHDQCWGMFTIDDRVKLTYTAELEAALARVVLAEFPEFSSSFIRLSLKRQPTRIQNSFHLDSNATTGIGELRPHIEAWRLIANLSRTATRSLKYSIQDPISVQPNYQEGLRTSFELEHKYTRTLLIPPISDQLDMGVVRFCASEVYHRGGDDDSEHFIAAFGYDKNTEKA